MQVLFSFRPLFCTKIKGKVHCNRLIQQNCNDQIKASHSRLINYPQPFQQMLLRASCLLFRLLLKDWSECENRRYPYQASSLLLHYWKPVCICITLIRKKYSRRLLRQFFCRDKSRRALRQRQSKWSVCNGRRVLLKKFYIKSWGGRDKEEEEEMEDPQAGLGSLQPWQVGKRSFEYFIEIFL